MNSKYWYIYKGHHQHVRAKSWWCWCGSVGITTATTTTTSTNRARSCSAGGGGGDSVKILKSHRSSCLLLLWLPFLLFIFSSSSNLCVMTPFFSCTVSALSTRRSIDHNDQTASGHNKSNRGLITAGHGVLCVELCLSPSLSIDASTGPRATRWWCYVVSTSSSKQRVLSLIRWLM